MGLSTKQVPGDQALDWSQTLLESAGTVELPKPPPIRRQQQQQQQSEPLDCPRCGSTNTKFCYYNNYNKSQPRHFCKACKRHWTKGGTLRNVPVGGGRKNKRLKASSAARSSSATTGITVPTSTSDRKNVHGLAQNQQDSHNFSLPALGDQKNISDILYQALINSSTSVQHDPINGFTSKTFMGNKGTSSSPMLSLPQDQNLQLSFSSLSPFENIPSPIPSFHQSLNGYDYGGGGKLDSVESSTITTVTPATSSIFSQPWQGPTTSSVMADMPNYWNWNDIDTLASADLNIPWDDTEIKP